MKNYLKIDFELFKDARLNDTDIILLSYFSSFEKCFTSNETLQETFNLDIQKIQRTIKKLKRLEYISVRSNRRMKKREIISTLYKATMKKVKSQEWQEPGPEEMTEEEKKQAEELSARLLGKK